MTHMCYFSKEAWSMFPEPFWMFVTTSTTEPCVCCVFLYICSSASLLYKLGTHRETSDTTNKIGQL